MKLDYNNCEIGKNYIKLGFSDDMNVKTAEFIQGKLMELDDKEIAIISVDVLNKLLNKEKI